MSKLRPVANRYAQALAETIGSDAELDTVKGELARLAATVDGSKELQRALANPVIVSADKLKVLTTIAQRLNVGSKAVRFLRVLADHDRVDMIPEVAEAIDEIFAERTRTQTVELRTAAPLDDDMRTRVKTALSRIAGGTIVLEEKVEPELLGGMIARVGTKVYDASLKTKLENIRSRMVGQGTRLAG